MEASTGAFELIYRAQSMKKTTDRPVYRAQPMKKTTDRPVSSNQIVSNSFKSNSTPESKYPPPAPADVIKNIGVGMRQTLEDLLVILKNSKRKNKNSKKQSVAITASLRNSKTNRSIETVTSRACIETQTLSKIKVIELNSNKDLISSYQLQDNKMMKNEETNTVKYTKEYVLEILKNKFN